MDETKTTFVCAAGEGRLADVQRMLQEEEGLKINGHAGGSHKTAIDAAIESGHAPVVRWLLEQGAYTDANELCDAYKALAADWTSDRESVVRMLYERRAPAGSSYDLFDDPRADLNTVDRTMGLPPLFIAIQRKRESMARILLEAGALVDQRAPKYATDCHAEPTALMLAAGSGFPSCVKLLLEYGASTHEVDAEGKTALMRGTEKEDVACMTLLLNAGSPINAQSRSGRRP